MQINNFTSKLLLINKKENNSPVKFTNNQNKSSVNNSKNDTDYIAKNLAMITLAVVAFWSNMFINTSIENAIRKKTTVLSFLCTCITAPLTAVAGVGFFEKVFSKKEK